MSKPIFQFGNVVVVDDDQIGVVVKTWNPEDDQGYYYEVYVRSYNGIRQFNENNIHHFVYSKHLHEDEHDFY